MKLEIELPQRQRVTGLSMEQVLIDLVRKAVIEAVSSDINFTNLPGIDMFKDCGEFVILLYYRDIDYASYLEPQSAWELGPGSKLKLYFEPTGTVTLPSGLPDKIHITVVL